jgi:RNA polymerase sigma-70 factor (ECF subfamily)
METAIGRTRSDLINRAKEGDGAAFDALVDARLVGMIRLASAIAGNEPDARDAVQESLAIAWRQIRSLRQADRFDAWVTRILINECRRVVRAQGRQARQESAIPDSGPAAGAPLVEDDVAARDLVARAFDRIGPDQRALLALRHLDQAPIAEIAAILGIPGGTVKSRLHTAREQLERAIREEEQDES